MPNWIDQYNIYIAIILGIIGLIWLIRTLWGNIKINKIRSWPKATANVVNVFAETVNSGSGSMLIDPNTISIANNTTKFIPRVLYEYTIRGKGYQSNNVVYDGPRDFNAVDTKMILGQITPGENIHVYYNPHKPSESYIYNGRSKYTGIIGGIILLLIAGYLIYQKYYDTGIDMTGIYAKRGNTTVTEALNQPIKIIPYFKKNRMY